MNQQEIQDQLKAWSEENFGRNLTDLLNVEFVHKPVDPTIEDHSDLNITVEPRVVLDWMCPLLGMTEEVGELCDAMLGTDTSKIVDALSDISIYMIDFVRRHDHLIMPDLRKEDHTSNGNMRNIVLNIIKYNGEINHCVLKRFQNIRGMDNQEKYLEKLQAALDNMVLSMHELCCLFDIQLLGEVSDTWEKIVSKRNWKPKSTTDTNS